mgnify:FL=1
MGDEDNRRWRLSEFEFYEKAETYLENHLEIFTDELEVRVKSDSKCDALFKKYKKFKKKKVYVNRDEKIKDLLNILLEDLVDWREFSINPDSSMEDIMLRLLISVVYNCNYVCSLFVSYNPNLTEEFIEDYLYVGSGYFSFDEWDDKHVDVISSCIATGDNDSDNEAVVKLYDKDRLRGKPIGAKLDLEEIILRGNNCSEEFKNKYKYIALKLKSTNIEEKEE